MRPQLLLLILLLLQFSLPFQARSKTDFDLSYCNGDEEKFIANELIVKFKNKRSDFSVLENAEVFLRTKLNSPFQIEKVFDSKLVKTTNKKKKLKHSLGIDRTYKIKFEDAFICQDLQAGLRKLQRNSNISSLVPNYKVSTSAALNDPLYNSSGENWNVGLDEQYGLKRIKASQAWDIADGSGVVVAVIDTGVDYNHPDLWENIWLNENLVSDLNQDGKINIDDLDLNANHRLDENELALDYIGHNFADNNHNPYDAKNGHGTHIAGLIAASGNNNYGMAGLAHQAKIMPIKALGIDGQGSFTNIASAIIYASDMGADVINNSWDCDCQIPEIISDAFQYSHDLGVINVVAAGNKAKELFAGTAAALNQTISVSSVDYDDSRSRFSNYGSFVDIAAPGRYMLSTMAEDALLSDIGGIRIGLHNVFDYWYISGTSMSAAMLSGAAALIKSARPDLDNEEVRRILRESAEQLETDFSIGAGLLDLSAALLMAKDFQKTEQVVKIIEEPSEEVIREVIEDLVEEPEEISNEANQRFERIGSQSSIIKLRRKKSAKLKLNFQKTYKALGKAMALKVEVDPAYRNLIAVKSKQMKFVKSNKNSFAIKLKFRSRNKFKARLAALGNFENQVKVPVKIIDMVNGFFVESEIQVYL